MYDSELEIIGYIVSGISSNFCYFLTTVEWVSSLEDGLDKFQQLYDLGISFDAIQGGRTI